VQDQAPARCVNHSSVKRADLPERESLHHLQWRTRLRIPLCQLRVPTGTAIAPPESPSQCVATKWREFTPYLDTVRRFERYDLRAAFRKRLVLCKSK
jgi:hypothetical protein